MGEWEHAVKRRQKIVVREGGRFAAEQGMCLRRSGGNVGHGIILARYMHRGNATGVIVVEHERQTAEEPPGGR